jgi:hypothetical protein
MEQIDELSLILNRHFKWNKSRMDCFSGMLVALLAVRTINLTEIAVAFSSNASINSRYRRIQRFISLYHIDFNQVAWFIVMLFGFHNGNYYLTIDRTNWKWGKKNINILVLAIVYKGIAIPVYWVLLDKKGNSNTKERIALMKRFIAQFGKSQILGVFGDREFIGEKWLKWLQAEGIKFHIRIKENAKIPNSQGIDVQAKKLFYLLKVGEKIVIKEPRKMTGLLVYLSALRLDDGELLIIASCKQADDAIEIYAHRWEIETLFSCLKSRGFNFEDTHVTNRLRLKRLLVVAVIAFCWAHRTGEWRHESVKPIQIKKHLRNAQSIFRYGLDLIRDVLFNPNESKEYTLRSLFHFIDFKKFNLPS